MKKHGAGAVTPRGAKTAGECGLAATFKSATDDAECRNRRVDGDDNIALLAKKSGPLTKRPTELTV